MLSQFPLLQNEPLAKYTAARLGGAADWLYIARNSNEQLIEVVSAAWSEGVPVRVLGGGANVLVSDAGVRGLVVINRVGKAAFHETAVTVTAGMSLTVLARKCAAKGLAGFEWAVSIPGTVGGAVVNNAGAHGGDMAGCLRSAALVDAEQGTRLLDHADLAYAYRSSSLKARADRRFLVTMATLALTPGDPAGIHAKMDELIAYRKRTQPPGASLGSIFKNPLGDYAGRLIEIVRAERRADRRGMCVADSREFLHQHRRHVRERLLSADPVGARDGSRENRGAAGNRGRISGILTANTPRYERGHGTPCPYGREGGGERTDTWGCPYATLEIAKKSTRQKRNW